MSQITKVGKTNHADKAAKMRANPGKWFKVGTYKEGSTRTIESNIRWGNGVGRHYTGKFEVTTRGGVHVWARYVK